MDEKILFIGEMEITHSAGNLKASDKPNIIWVLSFLDNKSLISL